MCFDIAIFIEDRVGPDSPLTHLFVQSLSEKTSFENAATIAMVAQFYKQTDFDEHLDVRLAGQILMQSNAFNYPPAGAGKGDGLMIYLIYRLKMCVVCLAIDCITVHTHRWQHRLGDGRRPLEGLQLLHGAAPRTFSTARHVHALQRP
jgi:hypothetical protein